MTTQTENQTIGQFIEKHNLGFECKRVDSRPDRLMEPVANTGRNLPHFVDVMRHFRVRVTNGRKGFGVYFSQGSGHTADPTLADVLDCLASDASGYEDARVRPDGAYHTTDKTNSKNYDMPMHFDNWAEEYGYDTDSRKAEKIFKTVKRQAEQLKRTLGQAAYDELLYNTERA